MNALEQRAVGAGLISSPPFNLGVGKDSFRVPDGGWFAATTPLELYMPTAVAVLEVLSPGDETYAKLDFYSARGVREVLVVDPVAHRVECWLRAGAAQPRSEVFDIEMAELAGSIDWP